MARLPLGSTELIGPSIMLNILGDEWLFSGKQVEPSWEKILNAPSAKLHLYGKAEPRIGRKMGHINFVGKSSAAVELVCEEAIRVLKIAR
jgi:5-(carboxyamino)imidazole ribonucleotide synthase